MGFLEEGPALCWAVPGLEEQTGALPPSPFPPAPPSRCPHWEGFLWRGAQEESWWRNSLGKILRSEGAWSVIRHSGCCETGEGAPRPIQGLRSLPGRAPTKGIALYPHASPEGLSKALDGL